MPGPALFARAKPPVKPAAEIPEFNTLGVSEDQVKKAVRALLSYVKKADASKNDLLEGSNDEKMILSISLFKASPREYHNPIRIPMPHPIYKPPRTHSVCLFVKDPKEEIKERFETDNIHFINKVIGLDKLKKKYKSFEAKRELLKSYDLFLVDDRIVPEVGRYLGKMWRKAKKNPYAVSLSKKKNVKAELEKAISSTYLIVNMGTSLTLRVGTLAIHSEQDLIDNVKAGICQMAGRAPQGGWDNIQALYLKTNSSVALPIYQKSQGVSSKKRHSDSADKQEGAQATEEDDGSHDEESKKKKKKLSSSSSKKKKTSH